MYSVCFETELDNSIQHLKVQYPYLITTSQNNLRVYSDCLQLRFHLMLVDDLVNPDIILISFQQIFRLEMMLVLDRSILRMYDMKNGQQMSQNHLGNAQFRNLQSISDNDNCRFVCFQSNTKLYLYDLWSHKILKSMAMEYFNIDGRILVCFQKGRIRLIDLSPLLAPQIQNYNVYLQCQKESNNLVDQYCFPCFQQIKVLDTVSEVKAIIMLNQQQILIQDKQKFCILGEGTIEWEEQVECIDNDKDGNLYLIKNGSYSILSHDDIGMLFHLMSQQKEQEYLYNDDFMFEVFYCL